MRRHPWLALAVLVGCAETPDVRDAEGDAALAAPADSLSLPADGSSLPDGAAAPDGAPTTTSRSNVPGTKSIPSSPKEARTRSVTTALSATTGSKVTSKMTGAPAAFSPVT